MTGRVLVTVRCRHKGHLLAEFTAADGGQRVIRLHGKAAPGGPLADYRGEVFRLDSSPLGGGEPGDSYRVECACGRPHLVERAALAAAEASGETVIIAAPLR